jgi:hypothetical protein
MNLQVIIYVFAFGAFCLVTSGAWEAELIGYVSKPSNNSKPDTRIVIARDTPSKIHPAFQSN